MTTTVTTDVDLLRSRMAAAMASQLPGHIERHGGSAGLREAGLRQVGLRQAGLTGPAVSIRRVEALDRDPMTGKARRFIPLHARPAGTA